MFTLVFLFFSIGYMRESAARSLVLSAAAASGSGFQDPDLRSLRNEEKRMLELFENRASGLLDLRVGQFGIDWMDSAVNVKTAPDNIKDEIQKSFLLVKTSNRQRGKRYIQQRSHLTPCLFKICNMGRKRQSHLL